MSETKLIFDIDGVLIDTRRSYRWAIKRTAEHFLNRTVPIADVDAIKAEEGMNNDWVATHALMKSLGGKTGFETIKQVFQDIYQGTSETNGLRWKESPIFSPDELHKLSERYGTFSIITGRTMEEAQFVLDRFKLTPFFDQIVSVENVNVDKSNPVLLRHIKDIESFQKIIYIGDNVSDILLGRNARATLPVTMVLFTPIATRDERKILYQKADKYQPDQRFEKKEELLDGLQGE